MLRSCKGIVTIINMRSSPVAISESIAPRIKSCDLESNDRSTARIESSERHRRIARRAMQRQTTREKVRYLYISNKRPGKFDCARLAMPGSLLADLHSFLSLPEIYSVRAVDMYLGTVCEMNQTGGQDSRRVPRCPVPARISLSRIFSSALLVKTNA